MFDGVPPEQFHQFITPRNNTLHLPFPLHAPNNTTTFPTTFDPLFHNPPSNSHPQLPLLHPLHHHKDHDEDKDQNITTLQSMNFEIETNQRQDDPWTNDEVLALLRIRSSMDTWFPELTWEHVSRKLAELGYKRTADKCKDKFEEETRYFHNIHFNKTLEDLYQNATHHLATEKPNGMEPEREEEEEEEDSRNQNDDVAERAKERKRKRAEKFEMFKGFCESIVHNMMAQQEELHNKLLEDMMKRDQEKLTREEEWKKQEMEKMNKELEMMAREQAIAGDRQANIIEFLKKFSESSPASHNVKVIIANPNLNPNPSSTISQDTLRVIPSSSSAPMIIETSSVSNKDDVGRRWPKDEVLALINLRCASVNNIINNNNNNEEKEGSKAPLWERISQGMMELGYKRSAKRCKEKWENINKYFRKTKDANKKRSLDSRTCPYFHQLSNLYNQGKLVPQADSHDLNPTSQAESSGFGEDHVGGENKTLMQEPSLDFDHF